MSFSGDDAWQCVAEADRIYVASGSKTVEFDPATAGKDKILPAITGRTGNLRAPTLRKGKVFFVGYNDSLYNPVSGSLFS